MRYNDSSAIVDDMPLLSQWIKNLRSEERDFLAGMARFEGSAFGLLRKQPIVFGFAEGVRTSLYLKSTTSKKNHQPMVLFCWQGWRGSNSRMTESKSVALPLGYMPKYSFIYKNGVDDRGRTDDLQGHNLAL